MELNGIFRSKIKVLLSIETEVNKCTGPLWDLFANLGSFGGTFNLRYFDRGNSGPGLGGPTGAGDRTPHLDTAKEPLKSVEATFVRELKIRRGRTIKLNRKHCKTIIKQCKTMGTM